MATQCLHKAMTKKVMGRLGFSVSALELAAEANSAVDEKQGNTAQQTNLHSMCGFTWSFDPTLGPMEHLQTGTECRQAVRALLEARKKEVIENLLAGRETDALRRLGEGLHTVQDGAFHNFEPWPYRGIAEAFSNGLNYMICHAIRDLGMVSRLDLGDAAQGDFDLELTQRIGNRWYLSLGLFNHTPQPNRFPSPLGHDHRDGEAFLGTGGMLLLTFGAPPGSVKKPDPIFEEHPRSTGESPYWTIVTDGPAAQARAEDSSTAFIEELRQEAWKTPAGAAKWSDFLAARDAPPPLPPPNPQPAIRQQS